jgi:hypothetical protein
MSILAKLNGHPQYTRVVAPVLLQRLRNGAVNQFPMYAEMAAETIGKDNLPQFIAILKQRRTTISYPAKIDRIDKLLKNLV